MRRGKPVFTLLCLVALIFSGLFLQGCVTAGEYERLKSQLAKANETIDLKDQRIDELDHERVVYEEEALALRDKLGAFRQNSGDAEQIIADLRSQLASAQTKQGSSIEGVEFFTPDGQAVGIRVSDEILFPSGSHSLKGSGKSVLDMLVGQLKSTSRKIEVVGHTDSDPVVKTKAKYPRGNIQLSTERAMSVLEYLRHKGVSEKRMHVTGFGPHQPLVANSSPENKQRNRRVEIILTD